MISYMIDGQGYLVNNTDFFLPTFISEILCTVYVLTNRERRKRLRTCYLIYPDHQPRNHRQRCGRFRVHAKARV